MLRLGEALVLSILDKYLPTKRSKVSVLTMYDFLKPRNYLSQWNKNWDESKFLSLSYFVFLTVEFTVWILTIKDK